MQATLTPESPVSASTSIVNSTSVFAVEGVFEGSVMVQAQYPGGSRWFNIYVTRSNVSVPLLTPDANVNYRINSDLARGEAQAYLGVTL